MKNGSEKRAIKQFLFNVDTAVWARFCDLCAAERIERSALLRSLVYESIAAYFGDAGVTSLPRDGLASHPLTKFGRRGSAERAALLAARSARTVILRDATIPQAVRTIARRAAEDILVQQGLEPRTTKPGARKVKKNSTDSRRRGNARARVEPGRK